MVDNYYLQPSREERIDLLCGEVLAIVEEHSNLIVQLKDESKQLDDCYIVVESTLSVGDVYDISALLNKYYSDPLQHKLFWLQQADRDIRVLTTLNEKLSQYFRLPISMTDIDSEQFQRKLCFHYVLLAVSQLDSINKSHPLKSLQRGLLGRVAKSFVQGTKTHFIPRMYLFLPFLATLGSLFFDPVTILPYHVLLPMGDNGIVDLILIEAQWLLFILCCLIYSNLAISQHFWSSLTNLNPIPESQFIVRRSLIVMALWLASYFLVFHLCKSEIDYKVANHDVPSAIQSTQAKYGGDPVKLNYVLAQITLSEYRRTGDNELKAQFDKQAKVIRDASSIGSYFAWADPDILEELEVARTSKVLPKDRSTLIGDKAIFVLLTLYLLCFLSTIPRKKTP